MSRRLHNASNSYDDEGKYRRRKVHNILVNMFNKIANMRTIKKVMTGGILCGGLFLVFGGVKFWLYSTNEVSIQREHLECLAEIKRELPIDANGNIRVHHWEAQTGKWNAKQRWNPMNLQSNCVIWYVGGQHPRN